jgi:hypothetical protein
MAIALKADYYLCCIKAEARLIINNRSRLLLFLERTLLPLLYGRQQQLTHQKKWRFFRPEPLVKLAAFDL